MGNMLSCCGKCKWCKCFKKDKAVHRESTLPKPPICGDDAADPTRVISVKSVDYCILLNGQTHNTNKYELMTREKNPCLVVRRGQQFSIDITFCRPYDPTRDAVSFIFTVADAEKPSYGQGTLMAVALLPQEDVTLGVWSAYVEKQYDNHCIVRINTSPGSIVAQWKMDIDTKLKGNGALSYSHPLPFYLLFNPWCVDDDVYLRGEDLRDEYVLMDTGLIWRGSHNRLRPSIWKYSQYEKDILDCCLYLVREVGKVRGNDRGNPVKISRACSAAVNDQDDNGAVKGNWTDDYGGGTHPTKWIGSMEILQAYYKNKKPVKYGQCWVFAGVLATICRAIGLPCRVVTNYSSAHDTHCSLTVDYFVDDKGAIMEEMITDSIWNYHVWNEVWMKRPDIGEEYSGWQAIDATPQELSDDMYRCGPASVVAVKAGDILKQYDNNFLYAEVNADKVYWKWTGPTQPLKLIRKDVNSIGQAISTKAVGKWEREDITHTYKYPESTKEERAGMLKALKMSEHLYSRYYLNEEFNDIQFDFELRDDIKIGEPFSVVLNVKNVSNTREYTVHGNLRVDTVLYTGKLAEPVKVESFNKIVKPSSRQEIKLFVSFNEYFGKLVEQCAFNIGCLATVLETEFEYFAQDDFRVRKPDIKITINGVPTTGQEFEATIKLQNPLPIPLRKCHFLVEGVGEKQVKRKLDQDIPPGGFATLMVKFVPPWSGRHTIAAKFYSKEMDDVDGFLAFMVQQKETMNGNSNTILNGD